MPSKEIRYICNVCGKRHKSNEDAVECENGHYVPVGTPRPKYDCVHDKKSLYPESITVELKNKNGDTKTITYKR